MALKTATNDYQLNELLIDQNELRMFNRSNDKQFRLVISTKAFKKEDFTVKTHGNRLIIRASNGNKKSFKGVGDFHLNIILSNIVWCTKVGSR